MPIYLCREGHKQQTQEAAVNCGYCKRNQRKVMEANRDRILKRVITTTGLGTMMVATRFPSVHTYIKSVKKVIVCIDTGCIRELLADRLTFQDDGWHYKELEFITNGKATVAFQ